MVSLLIRLLAFVGLLWTGKQVAHQVSSTVLPGNRKSGKDSAAPGMENEMVHDPVCQTYLPKSLAIRKTIDGKVVYFCGHACAATFSERHKDEVEP